MRNTPIFSIVIPTYDRKDYLQESLQSVISQTFSNWECIVVNDHPMSDKDIKLLISEYNDDRILVISHEISLGGNAARNTGIKQAKGSIIAFIDDDDIWDKYKLYHHFLVHEQDKSIGLVYSDVIQWWVNDELPSTKSCFLLPENPTKALLNQGFCPATTSCVSVLKSVFADCGLFDENLVSFQDWDMWLRISKKYLFACIDKPLVYFRQHFFDRTSKNLDKRLNGLEQIIVKWGDEFDDKLAFRELYANSAYINAAINCLFASSNNVLIYKILLRYLSNEFKFTGQKIKVSLNILFFAIFPKSFYQFIRLIKSSQFIK